MGKKSLKTEKFLEIESKGVTFSPIVRNGWWVKFSMVQSNILLIFVSDYTGQTIIRHYTQEKPAVDFINMVIKSDPTEELELNTPE